MKKLTFLLFTFIVLFTVACSNNEDSLTETEGHNIFQSKNSNRDLLSEKSVSFLNTNLPGFELYDIDNSGDEFFIAELKTTNNVAYLVTDVNQQKIVGFANFNLVEKTTEMYDYVTMENASADNLNFYNTFKFNEFANAVNARPRRFWGWQCYGERSVGGWCYRYCEYFFLGMNNGGMSYPCGDLPGSNPKLLEIQP